MNEREQRIRKVVLPKLSNPNENAFYANYDHIVKHDCDYVFSIQKDGNLIEEVKLAQNVRTFVMPNLKNGAYTILEGAFGGLKEVTLIVTGKAPIKICHNAFVEGAEVKLILPKDMSLFHVRQKAERNGEVWVVDFPVIAKHNFHLSSDDFSVMKVDEMTTEILPFKISVDKSKQYDRVSHTVDEVKEIAKQGLEK